MTEHDTLSAALVAALSELTNVAKAHKADTGTYGYSFANIADLIAETRPILADHGLIALTPVHGCGDQLGCTVEILHTSGESKVFEPLPFPPGRDAQSTGSWITYMRRYALLAALGMGAEDDDGSKAVAAPRKQEQTASITAAAAKKGVLDRLEKAEIADAKDHAAEVWRQMFGDEKRPITQTEWDELCDATDRHIEDLKAMEPVQDKLEEASAAARKAAKA